MVTKHVIDLPYDEQWEQDFLRIKYYLRSHPGAVREYSTVKEEGAKIYPYDIEKYIEHKTPFIVRVYGEIGMRQFPFGANVEQRSEKLRQGRRNMRMSAQQMDRLLYAAHSYPA